MKKRLAILLTLALILCGMAALAEGTQEEHVQHCWIHDALVFNSQSTSVCNGLIGIPMRDIRLGVDPPAPVPKT